MKKFIMLIVSVFGCLILAAQVDNSFVTRYKTYNDSSGKYLIRYDFDNSVYMVPATYPEGSPHYNSDITVFQIVPCRCFVPKNDTLIIGKTFRGTYVENGCFEDVPEYNVNAARKLQAKKNQ